MRKTLPGGPFSIRRLSSPPRPAARLARRGPRQARRRPAAARSSSSWRSSPSSRTAEEQPAEQADREDRDPFAIMIDPATTDRCAAICRARARRVVDVEERVVAPHEDVCEHGRGEPHDDDVGELGEAAEPRRLGSGPSAPSHVDPEADEQHGLQRVHGLVARPPRADGEVPEVRRSPTARSGHGVSDMASATDRGRSEQRREQRPVRPMHDQQRADSRSAGARPCGRGTARRRACFSGDTRLMRSGDAREKARLSHGARAWPAAPEPAHARRHDAEGEHGSELQRRDLNGCGKRRAHRPQA